MNDIICAENLDTRFHGGPLDGQVRPIFVGAQMYTVAGGVDYIDGSSRRELFTYRRRGWVMREHAIIGQHFELVAPPSEAA